MAEQYKLLYFNIRGLVEPIRLLLIDNGIPFKNEQYTHEQWPAVKPTMPFGQMPCLYHNDIPLAQSGAIIRYLARKHNLTGTTPENEAYLDMVFEGINDLRKKYYDFIYRDSEPKETFVAKTAAEELEKLEKLGSRHSSFVDLTKKTSYLIGDKITFADYALFEMLDVMLVLDPTILDKFQGLKKYHDFVQKRPKLAEYLNSPARKDMKINGNGKQ